MREWIELSLARVHVYVCAHAKIQTVGDCRSPGSTNACVDRYVRARASEINLRCYLACFEYADQPCVVCSRKRRNGTKWPRGRLPSRISFSSLVIVIMVKKPASHLISLHPALMYVRESLTRRSRALHLSVVTHRGRAQGRGELVLSSIKAHAPRAFRVILSPGTVLKDADRSRPKNSYQITPAANASLSA